MQMGINPLAENESMAEGALIPPGNQSRGINSLTDSESTLKRTVTVAGFSFQP